MVRNGTPLVPLVDGGGHEGERRAGTQNVAGDRRAWPPPCARPTPAASTTTRGSRRCATGSRPVFPGPFPTMVVNGDPARRVAGFLNCAFPGVEAETLLVALDQREVYASSGSACTSGAIDPSHVLLAMGVEPERARSSVRFSLGYASTDADVDAALAAVPAAVRQLLGRTR